MSGAFESLDAVVIGGGITGLVAAHGLRKSGKSVALLEASQTLGGCIGSVRAGGYIADKGPQSLVGAPVLLDLVRELGIEPQLLHADRAARRYIYCHGRLNAVPMSPGQFLATPLLSARAKWRLLAEPFVARQTEIGDESIASFVARRAGRELVDAVVAPIVSGTYAGDPEKLSVRAVMPLLPELERAHGSVLRGAIGRMRRSGMARAAPVGFSGGNAALIDALSQRLAGSAYTGARVIRVSQRGAGFTIESEGLPERLIEARHVIVATPAGAAADLLAPLEPGVAEDLRAIEYPPLAQVVLAYPRGTIGIALDGFGFLACHGGDVRILGAVWNSVLFHDRCPQDEALITAFLGGATDTAIADASDEELARIAHTDVTRVMKIAPTKPKVVAGFRWTQSIPQYTLGHQERLDRIFAGVKRMPGLTLIGNYLRGPSVADCIRLASENVSSITASG